MTVLGKNYFSLLIGFLVLSCVNDTDFKIPQLNCNEPLLQVNTTPEIIKESATAYPTIFSTNDIIEGYVTSSDQGGNFYKTISFQSADKSMGFSIPVDDTNLYLNFEPGRKVFILLYNNYIDLNYNALRIGSLYVYPGTRTATIGRLSLFDYKKILQRSCTVIDENTLVTPLTIDGVTDKHLNTLIEFSGVQFVKAVVGKHLYEATKDTGGATNHLITDASGKKIIVRTSSFASFRDEIASEKSGTIRGVLTKYGNDYQFMPRYFSDIKLTENRF